MYEALSLAAMAAISLFLHAIVIIVLPMTTCQFEVLKSAVQTVKYESMPDINPVIASYQVQRLYDKLVDCIKSHQQLLA